MNRLVTVGLDGFHEDLLDYTPYIQSLYKDHPSGELLSTTPPVTAPAWASFQTGKNQGKHGVFDFVSFDENLDLHHLDGSSLQSKTFYEQLDECGYECLLYNLPFSLPARIDGDIVPSWLDSKGADPFPRYLYNQYEIDPPRYPSMEGTPTEKIGQMEACFSHNCEQFLKLVDANEHDFLFHLVSTTDWLQHNGLLQLYQDSNGDVASGTKNILALVDEYIETLNDRLDPNDVLLLISDHGFQTFDGKFYVNDWLLENGYLETGGAKIDNKNHANSNVIDLGYLGRLLYRQQWLHPILRPLKNIVTSDTGIQISLEQDIDIDTSDAYCLSKDESAIYISEQFSEEQQKDIRGEIINKLNEENGITAICRNELFDGPYIGETGDIIVTSDQYKIMRGPLGQIYSDQQYAHHSDTGIVVAVGNAVSDGEEIDDAHLIDIAPTILSLFDVPIPDDVDGNPFHKLLPTKPEYVKADDYVLPFDADDDHSKDGVENRLKNLGYL